MSPQHSTPGRWFDLPGHGHSPAPASAFTIADIATALHDIGATHSAAPYHDTGVSAGCAIGMELLLAQSDSLISTSSICTGTKIRTPPAWLKRAQSVRNNGTAVMIANELHTQTQWSVQ
jgi:alpha-beta hydrolase superfamily lysophospholipase